MIDYPVQRREFVAVLTRLSVQLAEVEEEYTALRSAVSRLHQLVGRSDVYVSMGITDGWFPAGTLKPILDNVSAHLQQDQHQNQDQAPSQVKQVGIVLELLVVLIEDWARCPGSGELRCGCKSGIVYAGGWVDTLTRGLDEQLAHARQMVSYAIEDVESFWPRAEVAQATIDSFLTPLNSVAVTLDHLTSIVQPESEPLPDCVRELVPSWVEQLCQHLLAAARVPDAFPPHAFAAHAAAVADELGQLDRDITLSLAVAAQHAQNEAERYQ